MRHPNPDMLLRIAQADAYAAAVEYVKPEEHPELFADALRFERYLQHPSHVLLKPGMYTDDTQMSCAVAEAIVEKGANASAHDFTDAFFRCFKRDERDGYSRGFQAILERTRTAAEMRCQLDTGSNRNGACVRAVPIGALRHVDDVVKVAGLQASTTHATYGGINSAIAVALMSHYALYDRRSLASMRSWCTLHCHAFERFKGPWRGPIKAPKGDPLGMGLNTAWAVLTVLEEEQSLMGILKRVIEMGGDTDSAAAIAWGIASCRYQDEALPDFMEHCLEPGRLYGPAYLKELGERLMASVGAGKKKDELQH